jgi:hypothetical protein
VKTISVVNKLVYLKQNIIMAHSEENIKNIRGISAGSMDA